MCRCEGPCCMRSWQMQSFSIWPIILLQDSFMIITSSGPQSIIPMRLSQWLSQQWCLSLQVFSFGQEQPWQQGPPKALFCPCAHISVHTLSGHTGMPEPGLLQIDLVLACSRNALWRYVCSQQLWWLKQPVLGGLGAAEGQDEAKSKESKFVYHPERQGDGAHGKRRCPNT